MPLSPVASSRGVPLGIAGATAATRYVGATSSGAPVSGTFALGDFVVDQSGAVWVCTVAGSPGTWASVGGGGAPVASVFGRTGAVVAVNGDYMGVVASALTGAVQATRYVGATSSGAPVSGTFALGDFVITQDGHVFVCTVAGSPGTWTDVAGAGGAVASVFGRTGAVVAVSGDYMGVVASALTGATQASRYVGATSSGAPTTGTFAVGDFVIDRAGLIWVCTSAGTPGTWAVATPTHTSGTAAMAADVTMTPVNTFVDGPNTGSIGAAGQVLLLMGYATGLGSAAGHQMTARLTDGTTTFAEASALTAIGGGATIPLGPVVISPSGAATYKIQAASSTGAADVLKAAASSNSSGNLATRISYVRLA